MKMRKKKDVENDSSLLLFFMFPATKTILTPKKKKSTYWQKGEVNRSYPQLAPALWGSICQISWITLPIKWSGFPLLKGHLPSELPSWWLNQSLASWILSMIRLSRFPGSEPTNMIYNSISPPILQPHLWRQRLQRLSSTTRRSTIFLIMTRLARVWTIILWPSSIVRKKPNNGGCWWKPYLKIPSLRSTGSHRREAY